jgi:hypothetical protein
MSYAKAEFMGVVTAKGKLLIEYASEAFLGVEYLIDYPLQILHSGAPCPGKSPGEHRH